MGVKDREEELITTFIQQGPEVLRARMGKTDDAEWKAVFDHLVFSGDALTKCVVSFMPFFKSMVMEHGPVVIREIFDIWDAKYDSVFERLFNLIAISNRALYDYAYINRHVFSKQVQSGEGGEVRKSLCLTGPRYATQWEEILQMLIDSVCDSILLDRMNQDNLKALAMLLGTLREQRSFNSLGNE
jgi:hypothetical protein